MPIIPWPIMQMLDGVGSSVASLSCGRAAEQAVDSQVER